MNLLSFAGIGNALKVGVDVGIIHISAFMIVRYAVSFNLINSINV
jgi:hypothetical protein